jgi:hypothetical protein
VRLWAQKESFPFQGGSAVRGEGVDGSVGRIRSLDKGECLSSGSRMLREPANAGFKAHYENVEHPRRLFLR